ncbi:MAG: signal peptidase I [Eubacteriales bacterium]|nr:signal peptidase I [Eubacteriales bacterium]
MRKILKVFNIIILVVLIALLVMNLYSIFTQVVLKEDLPKIFGYSRLVIISGSMSPAIEAGDLIMVKEYDSYAVNDVIAFRSGNSIITHRIIGFEDDKAVTKGDFNNVADKDPVDRENIVGKVVYLIPKVGNVILFLRSPLGVMILTSVIVGMTALPYIFGKHKGEDDNEEKGNS